MPYNNLYLIKYGLKKQQFTNNKLKKAFAKVVLTKKVTVNYFVNSVKAAYTSF